MPDHSPIDVSSLLNHIQPTQLVAVLDLIPDTLFWMKNTAGQLVCANQLFLETFNLGSEKEARGLTDFDFVPKHLAEQFMADDDRVMQGEVIDDVLEMNTLNRGEITWFSTTKRALYDAEGQCIGTYGVSWRLNQSVLDKKFMNQLKEPMDFIRKHYHQPITIGDIAAACNLSISALERRFHNYLGQTPKQFLTEFRLVIGHRLLLNTTDSIAKIASQIGYTEPGYFTRLYTRHYGQSPSASRRKPERDRKPPSPQDFDRCSS